MKIKYWNKCTGYRNLIELKTHRETPAQIFSRLLNFETCALSPADRVLQIRNAVLEYGIPSDLSDDITRSFRCTIWKILLGVFSVDAGLYIRLVEVLQNSCIVNILW